MKIEGKVCVVVGAARGIGKAYCKALLDKGAKGVVVADILEELGQATTKAFQDQHDEDRVIFVKCDTTHDEDIRHLFQVTKETFGRPEVVLYSAGIVDEFQWQMCLDVNLGGCVRTTLEALKYMSKAEGGAGGTIVLTGSILSLVAHDFSPIYIASKYAVLGYTQSWALPGNYDKTGVRFNCICPTTVDTEIFKQLTKDRVRNSEGREDLLASLKKLSPDYVAEAMVMCCLEDDTINGKAVRVSQDLGIDIAPMLDQPDQGYIQN